MLDIHLAENNAFFLWGPRKVGKTTFLRQRYPDALWLDLLTSKTRTELTINPTLLRERVLASSPELVVVDEIQKAPLLLDEIHWCLENTSTRFIMSGSSARKVRRQHSNLLGGRAWRYELFPLVSSEIDLDLNRAINHGTVPQHYLSEHPDRFLKSYVLDYLSEEIQQEAELRNLPAFARFLDAVADTHGQLLSYANIARQCGVSAKTVRSYYDLLQQTLLGFELPAWGRSSKRRMIETSRFFLFDTGLWRSLLGVGRIEPRTETYGRAFEHLMICEIRAYLVYRESSAKLHYWRTSTGLEVDAILGDMQAAVEFKAKPGIRLNDLKGLRALIADEQPPRRIVVTTDPEPRQLKEGISVLPWQHFLRELWAGDIV